jgi:hypothetical protein
MVVNIYPATYTLYQGDYIPAQWTVYSYSEVAPTARRSDAGFITVCDPARPIGIKTHFARLSEDRKWLTLMDGHRYDACHVFLMARSGKKGMSIVPPRFEKEST